MGPDPQKGDITELSSVDWCWMRVKMDMRRAGMLKTKRSESFKMENWPE